MAHADVLMVNIMIIKYAHYVWVTVLNVIILVYAMNVNQDTQEINANHALKITIK